MWLNRSTGRTPLHEAAGSNSVDGVTLLLRAGAEVDAWDDECKDMTHTGA